VFVDVMVGVVVDVDEVVIVREEELVDEAVIVDADI